MHDDDPIWPPEPGLLRFPPVILALILVSVAVFVWSDGGNSLRAMLPLLLSSHQHGGLEQVEAGQVWRLVTPIFVHFGVLHLGFNMLWLWDLGRILETRRGAILTLLFVAVAAVVTGLAQFYLEGSPLFGGMSGVIYAMLGYIWVQGVCNPWFGYVIRPQVMLVMIGWLVLCWTGLLGPIANWAHVAGLLLGVAVGWLTSGLDRPAVGGSPA